MLEIVDKSAFEAMTLPDNLVLICRFQGRNHVFCSLYTVREHVFSAKILFVKTSTRIVKYESRVVKSNPERILKGQN